MVRLYISELLKQLPVNQFIRIHRSYVINRKFIKEIHSNFLVIGNFQLPVGRAYRLNLEELKNN